ncbi:hypothetical protein OUZ56_025262 [Daphnia magna]|uniref:Uncharacterized protein n=1 Tax=Daphnia magna TaxID=35525 RepID=A0ABQ9ZJC5_9CRUS|nr:hypothetical protein OUZ56_025262 [Daphnia magna]
MKATYPNVQFEWQDAVRKSEEASMRSGRSEETLTEIELGIPTGGEGEQLGTASTAEGRLKRRLALDQLYVYKYKSGGNFGVARRKYKYPGPFL